MMQDPICSCGHPGHWFQHKLPDLFRASREELIEFIRLLRPDDEEWAEYDKSKSKERRFYDQARAIAQEICQCGHTRRQHAGLSCAGCGIDGIQHEFMLKTESKPQGEPVSVKRMPQPDEIRNWFRILQAFEAHYPGLSASVDLIKGVEIYFSYGVVDGENGFWVSVGGVACRIDRAPPSVRRLATGRLIELQGKLQSELPYMVDTAQKLEDFLKEENEDHGETEEAEAES